MKEYDLTIKQNFMLMYIKYNRTRLFVTFPPCYMLHSVMLA